MIDHVRERRQRLTGIALMCGAVALFSCLDASAKYLNHYIHPMQAVWARYTGALLLALVVSNPIARPALMRTTRPWLQLVRSTLLLASTAVAFVALRYLQLDQALSILFATPFVVAALSVPMLGEHVGVRRWSAIAVGFLGVLVVTRPGFGGIHWAAGLSLISVICYGVYSITTRMLARTDSDETTLFYSNIVGAVVMLPVMPFVWTMPSSPLIVVLMVALGVFGGVGHYLLIIAHRLAPAAVLSPFIYTQLVWTTALGYLVFGDLPNHWTMAGAGIVVASGLYILYREQKVTGKVGGPTIVE